MHDCPIYVTGMMESGKSTFMTLLDGHPDLLVFPQEPNFGRMLEQQFTSAEDARRWSLEKSDFSKSGSLRGIEDQQESAYDHRKYLAELEHALSEKFAPREVMIETMRAFAEASNQNFDSRKYWVFNEPSRARMAPWLFSTFPNGKVIHLIRDPREHFAAIKAHHRQVDADMGRAPALSFSMDWALGVTQAFENRGKFGASRYLIVGYEDVRDQKEKTVRRIADFLNIEFDPVLLHPSKVGISAATTDGRITESEIGKWIQPLTRREHILIESLCGDVMLGSQTGYRPHLNSALQKIVNGLLRRVVYASYYGKRLLKGIVSPDALHELSRIDRAANNVYAFRL